jgi:hypothetical protein
MTAVKGYIEPKSDEAPFPFDFDPAYRADGHSGITWRVYGYESEPDEDTEWTGYEVATGLLVAHMVGDDRTFTFGPDELTPLEDEDYCSGCGQIGCGWC